ncbi:MAG: Glu-tRNA(Gln) amidotransferase subunit GatE, partial [candidate division Zixibacteria bacterium]|nr:Glu-tRNA(Gln) amidotransferase subunit GatE [candidate division Zixibacteria bacterium]
GYIPRREAGPEVYSAMGFKCGLEIHQQLKTVKKLFCRCPAGIYQHKGAFDAELIRHMRPTLSELGEYDGTALMEFRTRKNIIYRIQDATACTYDIDDTPPFGINREALEIALEVALLLKTNIVGELHITRKQYLDGSIPTGFQRTAIIGIDGEIPLSHKTVRLIQLSIEEDSCREVSDIGHIRTYTTDRLGIPLIESVTHPEMLTPDEVAEAGQYLRYLVRSTGKARTGIGAARQDTNVSIEGGRRVEIKGVSHIKWLPELTHNEAFRQRALLEIRKMLMARVPDPTKWKATSIDLDQNLIHSDNETLRSARHNKLRIVAVNLPAFAGIMAFFTQPGKCFADELSGRLKVIACLEQPNMTHSEAFSPEWDGRILGEEDWNNIRRLLSAGPHDAQVIFWAAKEDVKTATETIEERCRLAWDGVPNETRKALSDGTTIFERVLPGPDRMYPDTDSAPIPIEEELIDKVREHLPLSVQHRIEQLHQWTIPEDTYGYLLKRNLVWIIEKIIADFDLPPRFVGTFFGHHLRHIETRLSPSADFNYYTIYGLFKFIHSHGLDGETAKVMLPELYVHPHMVFDSVLAASGYRKYTTEDILAYLPNLRQKYSEIKTSKRLDAECDWIMGRLRPIAIGNMPLAELRRQVEKGMGHE